ncbi:MAG: sulfite exporter TauE/SafE family protein [Pseudomonadota bacterium]
MEILFVLAGAVVGFVIGLTGIGGGSLMTPILVLGFGISPAIAVGTDLLYAAITKCSGVFFHQRHGTVDWKVVMLLGLGSIPASVATIILLDHFRGHGFNYEKLMTLTLSIMLIITSIVIAIKNRLLEFIHSSPLNNGATAGLLNTWRPYITTLAGTALGVLVTISSVGAGAIGAAILFLLYPRKKAISIVGTDLAHAVPLTAVAGIGHMHFGSVDVSLLVGLLCGGIPAIYLGSYLGKSLPDRVLRPLVSLILLALGIRLAV